MSALLIEFVFYLKNVLYISTKCQHKMYMHLKKYLHEQKIRYREFAEKLGINEQTVKNIVAGTTRPGLLLALKIEKLTEGQITPSQLVEDFENMTKAKAEQMRSKGSAKSMNKSSEKMSS